MMGAEPKGEYAMFYHASQTPHIETLEPRVSNENVPRIYFSDKRENVLVYLSNAVERTCRRNGFVHAGKWQKWATYGFTPDGLLHFSEYYAHALEDTYAGAQGYIYSVEPSDAMTRFEKIRNCFYAEMPQRVAACEPVPDALEALLKAEREGKIVITRYEELSPRRLEWIRQTTFDEYRNAVDAPDYRFFLKTKYPFLESEE
jgi:hypothetical protein